MPWSGCKSLRRSAFRPGRGAGMRQRAAPGHSASARTDKPEGISRGHREAAIYPPAAGRQG